MVHVAWGDVCLTQALKAAKDASWSEDREHGLSFCVLQERCYGFRHIRCSELPETEADAWASPQVLRYCGSGVGSGISSLRPVIH